LHFWPSREQHKGMLPHYIINKGILKSYNDELVEFIMSVLPPQIHDIIRSNINVEFRLGEGCQLLCVIKNMDEIFKLQSILDGNKKRVLAETARPFWHLDANKSPNVFNLEYWSKHLETAIRTGSIMAIVNHATSFSQCTVRELEGSNLSKNADIANIYSKLDQLNGKKSSEQQSHDQHLISTASPQALYNTISDLEAISNKSMEIITGDGFSSKNSANNQIQKAPSEDGLSCANSANNIKFRNLPRKTDSPVQIQLIIKFRKLPRIGNENISKG